MKPIHDRFDATTVDAEPGTPQPLCLVTESDKCWRSTPSTATRFSENPLLISTSRWRLAGYTVASDSVPACQISKPSTLLSDFAPISATSPAMGQQRRCSVSPRSPGNIYQRQSQALSLMCAVSLLPSFRRFFEGSIHFLPFRVFMRILIPGEDAPLSLFSSSTARRRPTRGSSR